MFDKGGQIPKELSGTYTRAEEAYTAARVYLAKHPERMWSINEKPVG